MMKTAFDINPSWYNKSKILADLGFLVAKQNYGEHAMGGMKHFHSHRTGSRSRYRPLELQNHLKIIWLTIAFGKALVSK